ncbi:hypothetical protein NMG60_11025458 [Bertholletia excelsa]
MSFLVWLLKLQMVSPMFKRFGGFVSSGHLATLAILVNLRTVTMTKKLTSRQKAWKITIRLRTKYKRAPEMRRLKFDSADRSCRVIGVDRFCFCFSFLLRFSRLAISFCFLQLYGLLF